MTGIFGFLYRISLAYALLLIASLIALVLLPNVNEVPSRDGACYVHELILISAQCGEGVWMGRVVEIFLNLGILWIFSAPLLVLAIQEWIAEPARFLSGEDAVLTLLWASNCILTFVFLVGSVRRLWNRTRKP